MSSFIYPDKNRHQYIDYNKHMKRTIYSLIILSLTMQWVVAQEKQLVQLWESTEKLPVPESVLYFPEKDALFVSLIDGEGTVKDGQGGLATLHIDGSLKDAYWIAGLNAPKGIATYDGKLYVADIDELVVIDIAQAQVIDKIQVADATFLNDVTVDRDGIIYISDTRQHKIFTVKEGKVECWLDSAKNVNGLKVIDDQLYALVDTELWKIDHNKQVTIIASGFEKGGDGLEPVGNGDFLVTCWPGIIYYVYADGTFHKLLDVQGQMNTADLGYNQEEKILYVPTFNSNSVIAYQLR